MEGSAVARRSVYGHDKLPHAEPPSLQYGGRVLRRRVEETADACATGRSVGVTEHRVEADIEPRTVLTTQLERTVVFWPVAGQPRRVPAGGIDQCHVLERLGESVEADEGVDGLS